MEAIGWRMPCPGRTKRGATRRRAARSVSWSLARSSGLARNRLNRVEGNAMTEFYKTGCFLNVSRLDSLQYYAAQQTLRGMAFIIQHGRHGGLGILEFRPGSLGGRSPPRSLDSASVPGNSFRSSCQGRMV